MTILIILSVIFISAAVVSIWSKYKHRSIYKFAKLIPVSVLILFLLIKDSQFTVFRILIIFALVFSLIGDYFLLHPETKFKYGLISFMIAHIFYSTAFINEVNTYNWYLVLPVLFYSILFLKYLGNEIENYKIPVYLYTLVISVMLWSSLNGFYSLNGMQEKLILAGGILFVFSDSALAINKFKRKFKFAEFTILGSYYAAQLLFALSVN